MAARQRGSSACSGSSSGSALSSGMHAAEMVEKKIEETLTVLWEDLPHWMQDNHYIRGSYRPVSNSYLGSFASLGYLHNESVNIYSHLLGAIVFSIISVFLYNILEPRYATSSRADVIAFGCFFLGVAVCLGMSATYHAISNHSPEVSRFGNKLDYIGIVFLITGSFVPSIYYGFYCHPTLYKLYWTMISSLGFGCAVVSSLNRFRTPQWRTFRASMFVALGLSAVIPVLHGLDMYGVEGLEARMALFWVILQGSLYIIGAAIYAARIPERIRPGAFDVFGSSHQIFHFLVVAAAASHLIGLIKAFDYNHRTGARCG